MTLVIPVNEQSRIAEIRRAATGIAHEEGLDDSLIDRAAIVATEIATNLLKHASNGEVVLTSLSGRASAGIEILSIDRGPGMRDVPQCLADGYSSAQTSGTGLGAMVRLSTGFDIYSQEHRGTVLVARVQKAQAHKPDVSAPEAKEASVPVPSGEEHRTQCGAGPCPAAGSQPAFQASMRSPGPVSFSQAHKLPDAAPDQRETSADLPASHKSVALRNPSEPLRSPLGAILKPVSGENVSGDAWALRRHPNGFAVLLADGLGHGPMAEAAASNAISAFHADTGLLPGPVIRRVHAALRGTRGAAVAVAHIDFAESKVRYAGIGNIGGLLLTGGKPVHMISHNGTAGFEFPRLQEFLYPLEDETLLVMHSDGLQPVASLDAYPGLRRHDPSLIAGVLYRDLARQRDDICVVVARVRDFR